MGGAGGEVSGGGLGGGYVIDFTNFLLFQCDHLVHHENP